MPPTALAVVILPPVSPAVTLLHRPDPLRQAAMAELKQRLVCDALRRAAGGMESGDCGVKRLLLTRLTQIDPRGLW